MLQTARRRPTRAEIEPAALKLLQQHGATIMATARRYAATPEDAEDAYQRGVEILLTKAPTTAEEELVPWLRTVVKHEAWALRRQRNRHAPVADDGEVPEPSGHGGGLPHDQAERIEQLQLGAEAMRRLKPQEVRALLLKAEGYSYKQIQEITGWTYTKVNRCLTEGRAAFRKRLAEIEAGSECERLAPYLSRLADGEATADDMTTLRPHLRTCLSCRAALREYRQAPATAAALFPAAVFASPERPAFLDAAAAWFQKTHSIVEMASAQKVAAVAASTAALAGGGTVAVTEIDRRADEKPKAAARVEPQPEPRPAAPPPVMSPAPVSATAQPVTRRQTRAQVRRQRERAQRRREAERQRQVEASTPPPQQEFDPAFAAAAPEPARDTSASTAAPAPAKPKPQPSGGGAEEFAP